VALNNPYDRALFSLLALLLLSACRPAQEQWRVGAIGGAQFRVRVPADWNRSLVLAVGGYSPFPLTFRPEQPVTTFPKELLAQGYAYAETGYSEGGLAIAEGVEDVRALRDYFTEKYVRPERTFVVGESKGGLIALLLMETAPAGFDGALAISGLLSRPYDFMKRAFDLLALYEREIPGVLPAASHVPSDYVADEQTVRQVLGSLEAHPDAALTLRERASVRRNEELAELLAFHTDALRDLQTRCAGNPFDSESGKIRAAASASPSQQVAADPKGCAQSLPAPTGMLQRPLLAIDAQYDPVIPGSLAQEYIGLLQSKGNEHLFVREVVPAEGHLNVGTADRLRAFAALVRWSVNGVRPSP
jgi:predicted esterase